MFTRRGVATIAQDTPAAEALRLLDAQGFGPVLVLGVRGGFMQPLALAMALNGGA